MKNPFPHQDINECHIAVGHPSEAFNIATTHAEGILWEGTFNPSEDCNLKRQDKLMEQVAVPRSINKGEQLLIDISAPSTKCMGG